MRIYLCDESAKERSAIKKCVDKYLRGNYQVSIKEFSSVENMLSELPINKPSLMIVNLPEQKIKDPVIVQKLQGRKSNQKMIMTAASECYAMDAFSVYADGFLIKPFVQQQVDCALNRFQNMFYQMKKNISFMVDRTMKRFCLDEIIYMETCGHATMIHTLHGGDFVTCGKSYYINAGYIKDVTKTEIILRGGEQIFIPIRLQKELCLLWQMKVNNNI